MSFRVGSRTLRETTSFAEHGLYFEDVMIPEAVFEEIVHGNVVQYVSAIELEKAVLEHKVSVIKVENQSMVEQLQGRLHRGEAEVIVGAKELGISIVVIDDRSVALETETIILLCIVQINFEIYEYLSMFSI